MTFDQMIDQPQTDIARPVSMNMAALTPREYAELRARQDRVIETLETTKTPQIADYLRTGDGMCAVGVICELYRQMTGQGTWQTLKGKIGFVLPAGNLMANTESMPNKVSEFFGMYGTNGSPFICRCPRCPRSRILPTIGALNDDGMTLRDIGAYLRRYRHHYMTTEYQVK